MLTSKRHEWILQMIKGPDISPVEYCPGCYQSRSPIRVTSDSKQVIVLPTDLLDLSNAEYLIVRNGDLSESIAWQCITGLDFDEEKTSIGRSKKERIGQAHRMASLPLGKKIV